MNEAPIGDENMNLDLQKVLPADLNERSPDRGRKALIRNPFHILLHI